MILCQVIDFIYKVAYNRIINDYDARFKEAGEKPAQPPLLYLLLMYKMPLNMT